MPRIEIRNEQKVCALNLRAVRNLADFVLREEGAFEGEVSLLFTGDEGIRIQNRSFLKRDRPTDVLAFPPARGEGDAPARFLGDVAVSVERAVEQSVRFRQSPADELALCLVHGILHLLGHADHPPRRRRAMARREQEILRRWKATRDLVRARCRPAPPALLSGFQKEMSGQVRAGGQAAASHWSARAPQARRRRSGLRRAGPASRGGLSPEAGKAHGPL